MEDEEDIGFSPRSSIPIDVNNEVSTAVEVPSSGSTTLEDNDLVTSIENTTSQGEIGSNLETDMPVDMIVTTQANKDHLLNHIIGDPSAGVRTKVVLQPILADMSLSRK